MSKNDGSLTRSSRSQIDAFLGEAKKVPARSDNERRGRLIFAMDATASRGPTWDHACRIQGEMFEATRRVGGLDVQLCYYRGFAEFHVSPWSSDAAALLREMTAVTCLAGETQAVRVLQHALDEHRRQAVNALVLVVDSMEESVDRLCGLAGQLGLVGVPAFVFQEGRDPVAERAYREVARLSGGAWSPFDTRSATELRDLLGAVAVYAAGGRAALESHGATSPELVASLARQLPKR